MLWSILAVMADQDKLFEIQAEEAAVAVVEAQALDPKLKAIDRNQFRMLTLDVERGTYGNAGRGQISGPAFNAHPC